MRSKRPILYFVMILGGIVGGATSSDVAVGAPKVRKSRLTRDESEAKADRRTVLLSTGEDKAVDLDFEVASSDAVIEGDKTKVIGQLVKMGTKHQVVFKPLKAGETTVTVRDQSGEIKVIFNVRITGSNLLRVKSEVRDLLRDIEGIDTRIVGSKVIVEGEVLVPNDYAKLLAVLGDKAYSDSVMNLTTLSPMAIGFLARKIQEDVNNFAPNVRTRVVNGIIFLEGSVDSVDQAKRAGNVAALYLPEVRPGNVLERVDPSAQRATAPRSLIQNFIVVNPPPPRKQEKLIRVTVHFVELAKDYHSYFGFKWQPGFSADPKITLGQTATGVASGSDGASFSATISSLFPKLKNAQDAGFARVLKSGTMIVRSGQPAKLTEATEFPFQQVGPNGELTAAKQPVGLSIAVTPAILGQSEDIQMDLIMEQSNVVGKAPTNGGLPITAVHKVDTKIYVKSGESAAVAGVNSNEAGTDFNKDDPNPGIFEAGTDPLFTLQHTKNYNKKKSQFVVFVTPQIIENASDGTEDLKRNFRVKVK